MCGRYAASRSPEDLIVEYEAVDGTDGARLPADFNVAPTVPVHAVRTRVRDGVRELSVLRWGLVPSWAEDARVGSRFINARAETLTAKPAYRSAFARRRCLVPADGWFEWTVRVDRPGKQAYYMTPYDGAGVAFAGLWEVWASGAGRLLTCTIVTTEAIGQLTALHDRMPLVLPAERHAEWLDPEHPDPQSLLAPPPAEFVAGLEVRPVGPEVGNVANTGPGLLHRYDEPAAQTLF
ncbi:MAG: SOS response-associated peptidase [Geodermatophilaceae bacterium]|nr:SOS response-associated peptidase [Geodermatophilaceae bacterium]